MGEVVGEPLAGARATGTDRAGGTTTGQGARTSTTSEPEEEEEGAEEVRDMLTTG